MCECGAVGVKLLVCGCDCLYKEGSVWVGQPSVCGGSVGVTLWVSEGVIVWVRREVCGWGSLDC